MKTLDTEEFEGFLGNSLVLDNLIEQSKIGLFIYNYREETCLFNPPILNDLGYNSSLEINNNYQSLFKKDEFQQLITLLKNSSNEISTQFGLLTKTGETVDYICNGNIISNQSKPLYFIGKLETMSQKTSSANLNFASKILENQTFFLIAIDNQANYTYVNEYYLSYFDLKLEEIIGKSSLTWIVESDIEKCIQAGLECQQFPNKKIQVELTKFIHNKHYSILWEFLGITDNKGDYLQTLCIGYDISLLKLNESILKRREQELRILFENSSDIIYMMNTDFNFIYLSPSVEYITGYTANEIIESDLYRFIHPDYQELIKKQFFKVLEQPGSSQITETKFITKEGSEKWFRNNLTGIINDKNEVIGITGVTVDITELKSKELLLKENEQKLKSIVHNTHDIIFHLNNEGKFTFISSSVNRYDENTKKLMLGRSFHKFVHPDDLEICFSAINHVFKNNEVVEDVEYRLLYNDEKFHWHKANVKPLLNQDGSVSHLLGISVDINQQKNNEIELLKVKNAYERASIQAKLGNWEYHIDTGKIIWSSMLYEIFEVPQDLEIEIGKIDELYRSEDLELLKQSINNSISTGAKYDIELRLLETPSRPMKWVRSIGEPVFENGKCVRLFGTLQDISQRKANEQLLIDSKKYTESILSTIPDLVFIMSNDGILVDWVAGNESKLLMPPELFINKSVNDIFPAQFSKQILDNIKKVIKTGKPILFEYSLPIGVTEAYFEARFTKLNDNQIIVLSRDITLLHNAEVEKQKLIHRIQNQNNILQNYAHIISHNLRSHSSNITGIIYLLMEEFKHLHTNEMFNYLRKAADNLMSLVKHISETSSVFSDADLSYESINVQALTEKVINSIYFLKEQANVDIELQIPKQTNIYVHQDFAESIFLNLLTNAIKYRSPKRKAKILIKAQTEKEFVKISFQDNGLGIDLEKYGLKLFGLLKTFHENEDARGLGLFMVKNQIETMGGKIEVKSVVDKGTTFDVYLPKDY
ncbi:PAS domain S-box protein [bacterium]|nr:MAG: PAS domain S-box protein [bacterium]